MLALLKGGKVRPAAAEHHDLTVQDVTVVELIVAFMRHAVRELGRVLLGAVRGGRFGKSPVPVWRRLHGLAHRVVWVNPHVGKDGYQPVQAGIVAALAHVDDFVAGHSMATFAELVEVVGDA